MSADRPSLQHQIESVDRVFLSTRHWIARAEITQAKRQTERGTRLTQQELEAQLASLRVEKIWLPNLEAALATLRMVQKHEAPVRELLAALERQERAA